MALNRIRARDYISDKPNRPKSATALGYDPEKDAAPVVLASGKGETAERIIALAQEYGIPIREDPVLAAALETVDINQTIPVELYSVVAEVLAYVYRIRSKYTGTRP